MRKKNQTVGHVLAEVYDFFVRKKVQSQDYGIIHLRNKIIIELFEVVSFQNDVQKALNSR